MSASAHQLRLHRLRAYRYRMPLKRPYGTARDVITESVNFVVRLYGSFAGRELEGVGESQPRHELTGDGAPDNASAWAFLHTALSALDGAELDLTTRSTAVGSIRTVMADLTRLAHAEAEEIHGPKPFRGTLLGIEVALLDLAARGLGLRISQLLTERRNRARISIGTISTTAALEEIGDRAARQRRFPITRLKGAGSVQHNLAVLGAAARGNAAANRVKPLWIDINEAMDLPTATDFVRQAAAQMAAGELPTELIVEGPLPKKDGVQHADLQRIADEAVADLGSGRKLDLQIMADENIWDADDLAELEARGGCRAINIKAPKAGGLLACLDLADRAVATGSDIRLCIGGMLGTSELTAWALHNLGKSMPRIDYMTTVPPRNIEAAIAAPASTYSARGSNVIALQRKPGLGTSLLPDELAPFVEAEHDVGASGAPPVPGGSQPSGLPLADLPALTGGTWTTPPPDGGMAVGGTFLAETIKPGQVVVTMETGGWEESLRRRAGQAEREPADVAKRAAEAGAAALITSTPLTEPTLPVLTVDDPRQALWALGAEARRRYAGPLVAVTGTAGKSTTTAMLQHVLSGTDRVHYPTGNWNTIDGVSYTLAGLLQPSDLAVLEAAHVGFVGFGDWSTPEMIRPDIAIVTAIGQAHADLDDTLEGTARLKARLFRGLHGTGTAVLNLDTPHADILLAEAHEHAGRVITYGRHPEADLRLVDYHSATRQVTAMIDGRRISLRLGVSGEHNALNALAVLAVLDALGRPEQDYLERFAEIRPLRGRGQVKKARLGERRLTIVDQSYNANPASMQATLQDFRERYPSSRRVLVLGDMLELGDQSEPLHTELIDAVLAVGPARVFCVGEFMSGLWERLPTTLRGARVATADELDVHLRRELRDGDVLFVKSSHGVGLHRLVTRLQRQELHRPPVAEPARDEPAAVPDPEPTPPTGSLTARVTGTLRTIARGAKRRLDSPPHPHHRPWAPDWPSTAAQLLREHEESGRNLGSLAIAHAAQQQGADLEWLSNREVWAVLPDRRVPIVGHIGTESAMSASIASDKVLARRVLEAAGVFVPEGRVVRSAAQAARALAAIGGPVVVKPRFGSMGNGVTVNVDDVDQVQTAYELARRHSKSVLVERCVQGEEYRAHATDQQCVGVFRRHLPSVTGDGSATVRELIRAKNEQRAAHPITREHPIPADGVTEHALAHQGFTWSSVPAASQRVVVRHTNGITSGGDAEECLAEAGPDLKATAARAVAAIPGMDWGGVDLLVEEGTGTAYVLEVNTDAAINGSAYPVAGTPRDLGRALWERLYEKSVPEPSRTHAAAPPPIREPRTLAPTEEATGPISLKDLLQEHLREHGWDVTAHSPRIWTATDGGGRTAWFSHVLSATDTALSTFPLRRQLVLQRVLARQKVPQLTGRRVRGIDELAAFRDKHQSAVLLRPTKAATTDASASIGPTGPIDPSVFQRRTDWFARPYPTGTRLRLVATRDDVLTILAPDGQPRPDADSTARASALAVQAVRAVPQLRWAVVDVLVRAGRFGRRHALVESMTLQPVFSTLDAIVAGDLQAVFAMLLDGAGDIPAPSTT
ncbi:MAG TPA: hypothetical protein H9815_12960 [Candidatus Ruania gallistercoris]|uniref:ATP-grasp domain-containing protein n=1 Tax=Candidatus Ruania gallistercoris TaxID=2838746 RepID=A0A9D2J4U1_9MICO|nr:hypothetical protein [Candidatus Ruania gallistercoris]